MRENRSYGSVGVRGGNEPLYPDGVCKFTNRVATILETKAESTKMVIGDR